MHSIFELKKDQAASLQAAEALLGPNGHVMTTAENEQYDFHMKKFEDLGNQIKARERMNTIRAAFPNGMPGIGVADAAYQRPVGLMQTVSTPPNWRLTASPEYTESLFAYLRTGGKTHTGELLAGADGVGGYHIPGSEQWTRQRFANGSFPKMNAAMYEGSGGSSDGAGGYAINVPTVEQIIPLALPDMGLMDAATVIPTATDIKIPQQASFGTSALKTESNSTLATFGGTDPTLGQITLSAFMSGAVRWVSWELMQDVQAFQQFVVEDLLRGQRILEGQLLATGTGTGQAQGVIGNTGNGTGAPYQLTGASTDGMLLLDSLFDVTATLKAAYQANASWIMSRATALTLRKAQMQSNLYAPLWTEGADGTPLLLGRPVYFDQNMPALPTATNAGVVPILFGDFKQGYIIGVRGGAGVNVKILDQPMATAGQLGILAYRRLDARIRRSEAIQAVTISHS